MEKKKLVDVDETEFSEDEVLRADEDWVDFKAPDAYRIIQDVSILVTNVSKRHTLGLKLKCTDLARFQIRPSGQLILKPGESLKLTITRRPHNPSVDHRIDIYYARCLAEPSTPAEHKAVLRQIFHRRNAPHISILLRCPKDAEPTEPIARLILIPQDYVPPLNIPPPPPSPTARDAPPPPLRLDPYFPDFPYLPDPPKLKIIFFPPWNQPARHSFTVSNPSGSRRVAVKFKCVELPPNIRIRPSYHFLRPQKGETVIVERLPSQLPIPPPGIRTIVTAEALTVSPSRPDWVKAWEERSLDGISEMTFEIELRTEPYLLFPSSGLNLRFYKPHSCRSLAGLTVENASPFYTAVLLNYKAPSHVLAKPAHVILSPAPNGRHTIHFSVGSDGPLLSNEGYSLTYTKLQLGARESTEGWEQTKIAEAVTAAMNDPLNRRYELQGQFLKFDKPALQLDSESLTLPESSSASLLLHNLSSARLAVRILPSNPSVLDTSLNESHNIGIMEPNDSLEIAVTSTKVETTTKVSLNISYAFCINANPSRQRHQFTEARIKEGSVATMSVPVTVDKNKAKVASIRSTRDKPPSPAKPTPASPDPAKPSPTNASPTNAFPTNASPTNATANDHTHQTHTTHVTSTHATANDHTHQTHTTHITSTRSGSG